MKKEMENETLTSVIGPVMKPRYNNVADLTLITSSQQQSTESATNCLETKPSWKTN